MKLWDKLKEVVEGFKIIDKGKVDQSRRDFFGKFGVAAGASILAPKILAEEKELITDTKVEDISLANEVKKKKVEINYNSGVSYCSGACDYDPTTDKRSGYSYGTGSF